MHNLCQFLNTALTVKGLSGTCSLVTPISLAKDTFPIKGNFRKFPHLRYRTDLAYHTSAILAATVDTTTLPWRSRRNGLEMVEVVSKLNMFGRKVASAGLALPFPLLQEDYFVNFLEKVEQRKSSENASLQGESGLVSVTPGCDNVTKDMQMEAFSLRGINSYDKLKPKRDMRSNKLPEYTGRFAMMDSITSSLFSHFEKMNSENGCSSVPNTISAIDASLPTGCPFPHIFDKTLMATNGFLLGDQAGNQGKCEFAPILVCSPLSESESEYGHWLCPNWCNMLLCTCFQKNNPEQNVELIKCQ